MENNQKEIILLKDLGMLYPNENSKNKYRYGIYKCFCGSEFKANTIDLKRGKIGSCGCNKNTTHNLTHHRLYGTWNLMINRCKNSKLINFKDYGGKGVTVCKRWENIINFIEDMYPTFKEGLTLDRENPNGNYEPNNCRWTTKTVQSRNTRRLQSNNTSGYRGVNFDKKTQKWRVLIMVSNKSIYLGLFDNPIDGAKAYDNYVIINKLEHTINFKEVL